MYQLQFENTYGKRKTIAEIDDRIPIENVLKEASKAYQRFCEEHCYKIPYVRMWNEDGETVFDVGSHTEFFHLVPAVEME